MELFCALSTAGLRAAVMLTMALLQFSPMSIAELTTALLFKRMVDGTGKVTPEVIVLVSGDRIVSVGTDVGAIPKNANVVDLKRYTAIPGMIDVHTHLSWNWDHTPGTTPYRQPVKLAGEAVFLNQENALKTLGTGVTTIRDLNAQIQGTDVAMRNLINRGAMIGPRMFVAIHGMGAYPRNNGGINGPIEMVKEVREVIAAGADWVKLYASTGGTQNLTGYQTLTYEEIKAGIDIAHNMGKRVAVHSYGPAGAKDAVRAGADTIEHAIDMDDATLRDMVKRGTWYVPTIDHNRFYSDNADLFEFRKGIGEEYSAFIAKNLETTRRALKAGVKIAMGSDAVYTMAGQNTRELGALIKAGMTPTQALAAATTTGAALMGMEKSLGAIAPGYFADIVAVEGDPLADVNVIISNVRWVMKAGQVVVNKVGSGNTSSQ